MTDKVNDYLAAADAASCSSDYDGHMETIRGCMIGTAATFLFAGLGIGLWFFVKWLTPSG